MTDRFLSLFQFSGAAIQLTIYVAVFALMAAWEIAATAAGREAMGIGLASPIRMGRQSRWRLIILPFDFNNDNNPHNNEGGYREPLPAEIVSQQNLAKKKKQ